LIYNYRELNSTTYLKELQESGLYIDDLTKYKKQLSNIGIFRFKGYVKAFKSNLSNYSIDDIFNLYKLDNRLKFNLFKIVSELEIKLKAILIDIYYKHTDNPFIYLDKNSYKNSSYITSDMFNSWHTNTKTTKNQEVYLHYKDYYLQKYSFNKNREFYLNKIELVINSSINYPPFHYFIEDLTLGRVITVLSNLEIDGINILKEVANEYGFYQDKLFLSYLLRVKELRNRVAHNARIFNRNYRSVKAINKIYKKLRADIYEHRLLDVYYSLLILQNQEVNIKNCNDLIESFTKNLLNGCDKKSIKFAIKYMKKR